MAPQYVYVMKGLGKTYPPDHTVLRDIWLSFLPGAKIGVLGLNGAGKSTLLKIMAGTETNFVGEAFAGEGVTRRLPVAGAAAQSRQGRQGQRRGRRRRAQGRARSLRCRQRASSARSCRPTRWRRCSTSRRSCRIGSTRPTPGTSTRASNWRWTRCAARRATPTSSTLSGGERRRVALCRLLLQAPDLLLLDEPTNHLDAESVAWLERFLKDYAGTVVAVTHDRYFLDNVAGWILELDRGSGIPYEGNYSGWLEQKQAPAGAGGEGRDRGGSARCSASWTGSACRRAPARPRARPASTPTSSCSARTRRRRSSRWRSTSRPGPRLGDVVIEARNLRKAYGDTVLFDDLSFTLPRAGIVGVIGPNGAGKTTLFRMITGQEKADGGDAEAGGDGAARLRRSEPRLAECRQDACGTRSATGRTS